MSPNSIQYWLPRVTESGVPSPLTHLIAPCCEIGMLLDGKTPKRYDELLKQVELSGETIGYPLFLRFGEGSGQHSWSECCVINDPSEFTARIAMTCEDQACKDLSFDLIVLRRMIETKPLFLAFSDFPVTREFRFFAKAVFEDDDTNLSGKILSFPKMVGTEVYHVQPYWPADAIDGHTKAGDGWKETLMDNSTLSESEFEVLKGYCEKVIKEFKHCGRTDWSIDFLQDKHGDWFLTDMALAGSSYRWEPDFPVVR